MEKNKKFKAVMLDFDGTITEKGVSCPSKKMARLLIDIGLKTPIAFCSGRQIFSFKKHGFSEFLKQLKTDEAPKFLKNLFVLAENGARGYYFDFKKNDFKEFYRGKWPEKFIKRGVFKKRWMEIAGNFSELLTHRIIVVTTVKNHSELPINVVYKASEKLYKMCRKFLNNFSPNYEKYLHIGNSGLGILVCPANYDKDSAIKRFAKFLNKTRGIKFSADFREILVIGDSAIESGNDYYFLKGTFGTPYTVGSYDKSKKLPMPVVDKKGRRLFHEKGTIFFLKNFLN